jgi:hypothetical protein
VALASIVKQMLKGAALVYLKIHAVLYCLTFEKKGDLYSAYSVLSGGSRR